MNPILLFCCWITRARSDLVAQSNRFDQMTVGANGLALLTLAVVSVLAWTVFFGAFGPLWIALPLGLLIASIIVQLEAAIAASDWELAGKLRNEMPGPQHWFKLAFRVIVALLFSIFTAKGVMLALFSDTIGGQLQAKRTAQNEPLEREYAARTEALKARLIQPLESEIKAAGDARAYEAERVRGLRVQHESLRERASRATIEAGRELDGLGRIAGAGPRYRDATRQHEENMRLAASSAAELERGSSELRKLDTRVEKLQAQLVVRSAELDAGWRSLDQQKLRDPRWRPERDDPLLRVIALDELEQHSEYGAVVQRFTWLSMLLLIAIEMMFLMIKILFAPTSVYTVRLLAETKAEAAQVSAEYARRRDAIRGEHPRAELQIVDLEGQPQADRPGATEQSRGGEQFPYEGVGVAGPSEGAPSRNPRSSEFQGRDDSSDQVPVIGANPAQEIALRDAMADEAAYHVERETRKVYSRAYWDALHAGSSDRKN